MELLIKLSKKIYRKIRRILLGNSGKNTAPTIIQPKDAPLIKNLKRRFEHHPRVFFHDLREYVVDCLYCHAVPGTIEIIILELKRLLNRNDKKFKLLNLAGGTGQTSSIFRTLGFDVHNLDIEVKKESKKNIRFDLNTPGKLTYPEEYFDVVICQEIIEHVENPWDLFRKVRGVIKRNGYLILTTPNILSRYSRNKFSKTGYFHWFAPENFSYHINPLPFWEIELIAEKSGFEVFSLRGNEQYYFDRNMNSSKAKILEENEGLIYLFKKVK